jgi:predicted nucleic acid-binding protein
MNEQQENQLIEALSKQTAALQEQTAAITHLANSNMALCELILQALNESADDEGLNQNQQLYLNNKPVRG